MQKTVIAKGVVYNWEVADFVQSGETVRGFSFSYQNASGVPYTQGNIGFIDINEIIDFRDKLYFYANLKCDYIIIDKGYGYRIECGVRSINIYDNHGCNLFSCSGRDSDKFKVTVWKMKREAKKKAIRDKDILDEEIKNIMDLA